MDRSVQGRRRKRATRPPPAASHPRSSHRTGSCALAASGAIGADAIIGDLRVSCHPEGRRQDRTEAKP